MARSNELSDTELVQLIRDDPQQGFTVLLQQHGGRVHGDLRRRFPSLEPAELQDAVTDAMLRLADTFEVHRGPLSAWLLLLAHQQAVRRLRAQGSAPVGGACGDGLEWVAAWDDPSAGLETVERLQDVYRVVASLPDLERAVLEADLAAGHTAAAGGLARDLDTTEGSIYAARRRGRRKVAARCRWVRDWLRSDRSGGPEYE